MNQISYNTLESPYTFKIFCCKTIQNNIEAPSFLNYYIFSQMWYSAFIIFFSLLFTIETGKIIWIIYALICHGIAFLLCVDLRMVNMKRPRALKCAGIYFIIINIFNLIASIFLSLMFLAYFLFVFLSNERTFWDVVIGYFFGFVSIAETMFLLGQVCQFGSFRRAQKSILGEVRQEHDHSGYSG